ncbi:MAG: VWA domain-containing protein [Acidobacteriota bacterium]
MSKQGGAMKSAGDCELLRRGVLCAATLLVGLRVAAVLANAQQPKEEAGVSIVEVPVFVRDDAGKPVLDLKEEDFKIWEDGKAQKIEIFLPIDLGKRAESALPKPLIRRNFVFFFDVTFNSVAGLLRAKQAAYRFVDTKLDPEDRAAVFAFSSLKGVFLVANFTSDKRLLHSALDSLGVDRRFVVTFDAAGFYNQVLMQPPPSEPVLVEEQPTESARPERRVENMNATSEWMRQLNEMGKRNDAEFYQNTVSMYLEGMRSFARSIEFFPGRKYLIYFSNGFDTKVLGVMDLKTASEHAELAASGDFETMATSGVNEEREVRRDLSDVMHQAARYLASSDCKVFPIDTSGLAGDANLDLIDESSADPQAVGRKQASLFEFADETGGKLYKNTSDIDSAMTDILESTGSFYLLGYNVPVRPASEQERYHKIRVEIARRGLNISYRPGYHDPIPFSKFSQEDRQLQIAEVITDNLAMESIKIRAQSAVFPEESGLVPVAVLLQIPGDQFEKAKRELLLEVYAFAVSPKGTFDGYAHGFCRTPPSEANGKLQKSGLRYSDVLLVPPGEYELRILVRNGLNGDIGTTTVKTAARKASTSFAMATPFFASGKSEWLNMLGYDPEKPPARVGSLGGKHPISYRGKPCTAEIYPNIQDRGDRGLLIRLYNFSFDSGTKEPDIGLRWEIFDQGGRYLGQPQFKLLEKPNRISDSQIEYMFDIRAEKLPAGLCWLKVTATDKMKGGAISDWVPLELR